MFNLLEAGLDFRLSVLGEQFTDVPGKSLFLCHSIKDCVYTVNLEIFFVFYFRESSHMQTFMKIKLLRYREIILSFTDIGKSSPFCEFLASQIRLLTLFGKIKFSRNFPNLQYYFNPSVYIRVCNNVVHNCLKYMV